MSATCDRPTFERVEDQRKWAIDLANEVRFAMRDVKAELRSGKITFAEALRDERAQALTVYYLSMVRRGWGRTRTLRLLRRADIGSEGKRVRELTERQIGVLSEP